MGTSVAKAYAKILLVYAGIPLVGNAAAIAFSIFINQTAGTDSIKIYLDDLAKSHVGILSQVGPFPIVTYLIVRYIWPILKYAFSGFDPGLFSDKVTVTTLNAPFVIAMQSLFGWLLALVINLVGSFLFIEKIDMTNFWLFNYNVFLMGFLCFVIVYYLLEFLSKRFILPMMMRGDTLSTLKGVFNFSVQTRFQILFFSVGVFPVLVAFRLFYGIRGGAAGTEDFTSLYFIFIILGLIALTLTYLLGRSFSTPLKQMHQSTLRIRDEDYNVQLPVRTNDEIGYLAESLNVMALGLKEKEQMKETFGKVVDPTVRDYLLNNKVELGGDLVEATILFTDIRGFTSLSERMKPDEIVHLLNRYFERMSQCITDHRGLVNKYIGDAIMAIFGVPVPLENHAQAAASCALAMRKARDELNLDLEAEGLPEIKTGIGVHSGEVLAGNIGSHNRLEYTVIGDAVNLASRVEGLCKTLKTDLLLTEATFQQLSQVEGFQFLHRVKVKGKEETIRVFSYLES